MLRRIIAHQELHAHNTHNIKHTIMENNIVTTIIGAAALSATAIAGPIAGPIEIPTSEVPQSNSGDFCSSLKSIGQLYKSKDNTIIQSVKVFGRFQAQAAYVDGTDVNDNDFDGDFNEIRRFRAGMEIKAFNGLKIKGNVNLVSDGRPGGGDLDWGYQSFDQFKVSYAKKNVMGFDSLGVTYGRHKLALGQEQHTSSKKIKTVERSAIANKLTSTRPTGISVDAVRGDVSATVGFFSLDDDEFLGNWDAGNAIYASTQFAALNGDVTLDVMYNLDQDDNPIGLGYEWATSASWEGNVGSWDLAVNAVIGDNGEQSNADREGSFYGLVILPSKYIVEDKLEFVARYAYQGSSEDEGIRVNSRYLRRDISSGADINSGRGDSHHSIYAGLNYYFCGDNSKVMVGAEYDTLSTDAGDVDATTLWLAYRMYF